MFSDGNEGERTVLLVGMPSVNEFGNEIGGVYVGRPAEVVTADRVDEGVG